MTSESWYLILGSIIGAVALIVGVLISSVLQFWRDSRARKWELQDRQLQSQKQYKERLVEPINDLLNDILIFSGGVYLTLEILKLEHPSVGDVARGYLAEQREDLARIRRNVFVAAERVSALGSIELNTTFEEIVALFSSFGDAFLHNNLEDAYQYLTTLVQSIGDMRRQLGYFEGPRAGK